MFVTMQGCTMMSGTVKSAPLIDWLMWKYLGTNWFVLPTTYMYVCMGGSGILGLQGLPGCLEQLYTQGHTSLATYITCTCTLTNTTRDWLGDCWCVVGTYVLHEECTRGMEVLRILSHALLWQHVHVCSYVYGSNPHIHCICIPCMYMCMCITHKLWSSAHPPHPTFLRMQADMILIICWHSQCHINTPIRLHVFQLPKVTTFV